MMNVRVFDFCIISNGLFIPNLQYNEHYSSALLSLLNVKKYHRSYGYASIFYLD
jgi:hypothetical protein